MVFNVASRLGGMSFSSATRKPTVRNLPEDTNCGFRGHGILASMSFEVVENHIL